MRTTDLPWPSSLQGRRAVLFGCFSACIFWVGTKYSFRTVEPKQNAVFPSLFPHHELRSEQQKLTQLANHEAQKLSVHF